MCRISYRRLFMSSVERELRSDQKNQIHPSIALYCGNNENLGALNWREITEQREKYYAEYVKFNDDLVGQVATEGSARLFWPSSPYTVRDRSDNWHSDGKGDSISGRYGMIGRILENTIQSDQGSAQVRLPTSRRLRK